MYIDRKTLNHIGYVIKITLKNKEPDTQNLRKNDVGKKQSQ